MSETVSRGQDYAITACQTNTSDIVLSGHVLTVPRAFATTLRAHGLITDTDGGGVNHQPYYA
jgi:hypothetical protein